MLITEETKSDKSIRRGTQIAASAHHRDVRRVYVSRSLIDVADATETVANYNVCDLPFGMMDTHADLVTM